MLEGSQQWGSLLSRYPRPPRRHDYQIVRPQFYAVGAPGLLPEIPARAPRIVPLKYISARGPFLVGATDPENNSVRCFSVRASRALNRFSGKSPENNSEIGFHVNKCFERGGVQGNPGIELEMQNLGHSEKKIFLINTSRAQIQN